MLKLRSRGCVNAHARKLMGEQERPSVTYAGVAPGYAVFSRDFCKVYSHHDALPNHQLGRSRSPHNVYIHLTIM